MRLLKKSKAKKAFKIYCVVTCIFGFFLMFGSAGNREIAPLWETTIDMLIGLALFILGFLGWRLEDNVYKDYKMGDPVIVAHGDIVKKGHIKRIYKISDRTTFVIECNDGTLVKARPENLLLITDQSEPEVIARDISRDTMIEALVTISRPEYFIDRVTINLDPLTAGDLAVEVGKFMIGDAYSLTATADTTVSFTRDSLSIAIIKAILPQTLKTEISEDLSPDQLVSVSVNALSVLWLLVDYLFPIDND